MLDDRAPPAPPAPAPVRAASAWRSEWPLPLVAVTVALLAALGETVLAPAADPWRMGGAFVWLFGAILAAAIRVVHHADSLAHRLGEPYGTLILTLSVTCIEVLIISALMLNADNNPTLARDAMFAVVMIVLNGLVGLALILGALRYREQTYNLQGASAYLSVIVTLAVLSLLLPDATVSTPGPSLNAFQALFLMLTSLGLYATFLAIQTRRHTAYFIDHRSAGDAPADGPGETDGAAAGLRLPLAGHAALLLLYLLGVVALSKKLAIPIDAGISDLGLPPALGGLAVAALVLAPEGLSAIRAALRNRLQRAVNIALGSVLATIGLTVPAVLAIGLATGRPVVLGLADADAILLGLTLAIAILTFSSNRTNVLQGAVHLILFLAYLMLIFAP